MLGTAELKLDTGEVIPLQFGMWSKMRFIEMIKDVARPSFTPIPEVDGKPGEDPLTPDQRFRETMELSAFSLIVSGTIIAAGAENARMNTGNQKPVLLHEAMNWIDHSGGIDSEQVKKAIGVHDFFQGEQGELMEATPPKKQKSPGRKSKASQ